MDNFKLRDPSFGFLFARPSFVEGVARAFDVGGTLQEYNAAISEEQADALALGADWRMVGADLLRAMDELGEENQVAISEELLAEARLALKSSDQLEMCL